jgi:hypothetical protein
MWLPKWRNTIEGYGMPLCIHGIHGMAVAIDGGDPVGDEEIVTYIIMVMDPPKLVLQFLV